jgi:predicted molibdopterin-dependent oxidoreductase YjgC
MSVDFDVDGAAVTAPDGMTLSAVLLSRGVRALRRNPVSGQPRGAFCGMGVCFECEVVVDGRVARACLTPVRAGMQIATETDTP